MGKKAIVFGATGMVGKELLSQLLLDKNYQDVIIVVRKSQMLKSDKLSQIVIPDFQQLNAYKKDLYADDYFCCIGTTIKKAKTQEAFRNIDFKIPVIIANIATELNIKNMVIISSIGANPKTKNFYLRTKGEMETEVLNIFKGNIKFVRPSLLLGNRNENRPAEKISVVLMKAIGWILTGPLKKFRAVNSSIVAKAMIKATSVPKENIFIESNELVDLGKS